MNIPLDRVVRIISQSLRLVSISVKAAGRLQSLSPARPFSVASNSGVAPYRSVRCCWSRLILTVLKLAELRQNLRSKIAKSYCCCPVSLQYCFQRLRKSATQPADSITACILKWLQLGKTEWGRCSDPLGKFQWRIWQQNMYLQVIQRQGCP